MKPLSDVDRLASVDYEADYKESNQHQILPDRIIFYQLHQGVRLWPIDKRGLVPLLSVA